MMITRTRKSTEVHDWIVKWDRFDDYGGNANAIAIAETIYGNRCGRLCSINSNTDHFPR